MDTIWTVPWQETLVWPPQGICRGTAQTHVNSRHRVGAGGGLAHLRAGETRHRTDRVCICAERPQHPCLRVPQGELTITTDMEDLSTALFYDTVPDTWVARAYPSRLGLAAWYADLLLRIRVRTGFWGAAGLTLSKPAPGA